MKEREILEKAAKAAGYDAGHKWNAERLLLDPPVMALCIPNVSTGWNPLEDNGHALSLAVKLGMRVCVNNESGFSWVKNFVGSYPHGDDAEFATRLAIVMAAAQSFDKQQKSKAQPSPSKLESDN